MFSFITTTLDQGVAYRGQSSVRSDEADGE